VAACLDSVLVSKGCRFSVPYLAPGIMTGVPAQEPVRGSEPACVEMRIHAFCGIPVSRGDRHSASSGRTEKPERTVVLTGCIPPDDHRAGSQAAPEQEESISWTRGLASQPHIVSTATPAGGRLTVIRAITADNSEHAVRK
jgi:hypothetical protein